MLQKEAVVLRSPVSSAQPARGGRCRLALPSVQQLHQRLVQAGFHGMPLARPRDVAHVHFDSGAGRTQTDRRRG